MNLYVYFYFYFFTYFSTLLFYFFRSSCNYLFFFRSNCDITDSRCLFFTCANFETAVKLFGSKWHLNINAHRISFIRIAYVALKLICLKLRRREQQDRTGVVELAKRALSKAVLEVVVVQGRR